MCEFDISIDDKCSVKEIQQEFSKHYPYLKIEFFRKAPQKSHAFRSADSIPGSTNLRFIRSNHKAGKISAASKIKVAQLKQILEDEFGLHSKIFRKSGSVWIETSLTNEWTLEMQNREGFEISRPHVHHPVNIASR